MTRKRCGVFVTGTDTGVGKTIVTATLALAFQSQGIKTGVMKPLETGVAVSGVSDSDWLIEVTKTESPGHLMTPYRFRAAAAPVVAAAAEGTTIDANRVVSAFESLCTDYDCVIVEGVGGVLVPLGPDLMVADLIRLMKLPGLIVARSSLGSINHSLLTVQALRAKGISVLGFVFNNPTSPLEDADIHRTIPTILQLTGLPSFGQLPYRDGLPDTWDQHRDRLIAAVNVVGLLEALSLRGVA